MKTHEERVWHHEMETLEGIHEHAERIASLEELVLDMWRDCICQSDVTCNICAVECNVTDGCALERRITELGIEVWS